MGRLEVIFKSGKGKEENLIRTALSSHPKEMVSAQGVGAADWIN